jgi:hypothetical protein
MFEYVSQPARPIKSQDSRSHVGRKAVLCALLLLLVLLLLLLYRESENVTIREKEDGGNRGANPDTTDG